MIDIRIFDHASSSSDGSSLLAKLIFQVNDNYIFDSYKVQCSVQCDLLACVVYAKSHYCVTNSGNFCIPLIQVLL